MSPRRLEKASRYLLWASAAIYGLLVVLIAGFWPGGTSLLWPSLALLGFILILQARLSRKGRMLHEKRESGTLERLQQMKREMEKTAHRYRCLLEGAGNAIYVFDAELGRLLEVNRKGLELFGYSREEMLSLTGKALMPDEERRRFNTLVRRVKRLGRGRLEKISFCRRNGEEFVGAVEARQIDLGDERVVHVTVRDITFRTHAEKEIRQRNRELSILNSIISRANESLQLESVLSVALRETMEAFGAEAGMIHLQSSDGSGMNLATHHALQDKLVTSLERHNCSSQELFCCHSLPVVDRRPCLVAGYADEFGWKSLMGVPLFARQKVIGLLHILSTAERSYSVEDIRFMTTIGHQIGIVIEHARIFAELSWKSDELLRSHTLLERNSHQLAISQRRLRMNLSLVERANKDLERLDRMKSQFLGIVSHEFRTPLTSILGGTQFLMASRSVWSDEERRLLDIIHDGGNRLNGIVSNLLKVARLEASSAALAKSPLILHELLTSLRAHFLPLLEERGQELVFKELETIPMFAGDREHLEEVFSQLLENAIKFSRDGDRITIAASLVDRASLEAKREILAQFSEGFLERAGKTSYVQVEIRDSGIGIDAEEHLRIFDTFYGVGDIRHHSSGRSKFQGKGPGVGLTIVKGMVEAHGGMVWVESPCQNLGEPPGSTFYVLIPTEELELQPAFPFMQGDLLKQEPPPEETSPERP